MNEILDLITTYGLDTVLIAVATTILTGIVKLPIKKIAQKAENAHAITRFITFLPVVFAFGTTALAVWLVDGSIDFGSQALYLQWLTAASVSLAIYAFWEKFIPSKSKILTEAELKANEEVLEKVKTLMGIADTESESVQTETDISVTENNGAMRSEESVEEPNEGNVQEVATAVEAVKAGQAATGKARIVLRGGNHAETAKEQ